MDRNAVDNISVSYEEIANGLSLQIGQLQAELIASRILIQKLQSLLQGMDRTYAHQDADKNTNDTF